MKNDKYRVDFLVGDSVEVFASCPYDAQILAMAEKIKDGLQHDVAMLVGFYDDNDSRCYSSQF